MSADWTPPAEAVEAAVRRVVITGARDTEQIIRAALTAAYPAIVAEKVAEIERLGELIERNGCRWCLCSRADRLNDRTRPECPLHGKGMHVQRDEALRKLAAVEALEDVIRARLNGHNFNEPWDRGYKVGLRDALEDIARIEGTA